jgi:hypothetical protein
MTTPTIQINQAQLESVRRLLADISNGEKLAIRRAVQRTSDAAKTQIARDIGKKVTLKSVFIKKKIKSKVINVTGTITIDGSFIPLAAFKASPSIAMSQQDNPNGVSVKVYKDKGAIRLKHAFWAEMRNIKKDTGEEIIHSGLFLRRIVNGKAVARLKINELLGPSMTSVYENTSGLSDLVETTAAERLQRELDHQVQYILQNHPRVT